MERAEALWRGGIACLALALSLPAYSGEWYVAPDFSYTYPDRDLFQGSDIGFGLSAGKRLHPELMVELGYSRNELIPKDAAGLVDQQSLQLSTLWTLERQRGFEWLAALGAGASRTEYKGETSTRPFVSAGLGLGWKIPYVTGIEVQNEVQGRRYFNDSASTEKESTDLQAMIRLRYAPPPPKVEPYVVGVSATSEPSEPVAYKPAASTAASECENLGGGKRASRKQCAAKRDKDRDGVLDIADRCPSTIPGVRVDADGCMQAMTVGSRQ